jgi:hypothetical protein
MAATSERAAAEREMMGISYVMPLPKLAGKDALSMLGKPDTRSIAGIAGFT